MINNTAFFDAYELSVIFGEANVLADNSIRCNAVSTDSRTIEKDNIFVALRGENFDGHNNVSDALRAGAAVAVINKDWYEANIDSLEIKNKYIIVKDTLVALGKLARFHRDRFTIPVIAIAGSNGKTTTKEITAHLLSQKYKTLKTYKNFNNRVGVPFMLLSLDESFEAAILELGTNEPGEIAMLSNICNPTHGLITNIGKEHLEFLINLDGVEMEETFLFGYLRNKAGIALINMDDARLAKYEPILENKLSFGKRDNYGMKAEYTLDAELFPTIDLEFEDKKVTAKMQVRGIAPALNAIAASSAAFMLDLSADQIQSGIESYKNAEDADYGRMKVIQIDSQIILNDTYNANPSSMQLSLETLQKINTSHKKVAVLGDMFELGENAMEEHKLCLMQASTVADEVLVMGDNMKLALEATNISNGKHFSSHHDLANYLKDLKDISATLVKGSRGMQMEKVVNYLLG